MRKYYLGLDAEQAQHIELLRAEYEEQMKTKISSNFPICPSFIQQFRVAKFPKNIRISLFSILDPDVANLSS